MSLGYPGNRDGAHDRNGWLTKSMTVPRTWDTGNWDSGFWDEVLTITNHKKMNAKVATNLGGLNPRAKLAKFKTAITKCGTAPALANPSPALATCTTNHDAAETLLDTVDAKESELTNLRVQRDQALATAMANYASLGASVQAASQGDPAFITAKGFDVANSGGSAPPVGQIMNLVLTHGDTDGLTDASWNRDKSAKTYEVQTSPQPMTDSTWVPNQIAAKSSCSIAGQTAGSKLWVRVRGIGKDGPGLWSEPASIIVT